MLAPMLKLFSCLLLLVLLVGCNLPMPAAPKPTQAAASPTAAAAQSVTLPATATAVPTASVTATVPTTTSTPLPTATATPLPKPSATATALPTATATLTATLRPYPATPEGVVQGYLKGYPDQAAEMLRYLSKALKSALPPGGPGELLRVQGDLQGFAIQSGAVSTNPPQARVEVALQAGGASTTRFFLLVQQGGLWVIDGIALK